MISINHGRAALEAFCRVIEAWIAHFHGIAVRVRPLSRIDEPRWAWHIGLDAASTAMLNDLFEGVEVDHGRMRRLLSLFRMDFENASDMRRGNRRTPGLHGAFGQRGGRGAHEAAEPAREPAAGAAVMSGNAPLVRPEFWLKAKRELVRCDPVMAKIIRAYPRVSLQRRGEPFFTLARSIVGQQISVKAAQSIWNRVAALAPEMQPAQIIALRARARRLRAAGLSERKVEYIVDLAKHFTNGTIHPHRWGEMSDEEVIDELVQVRGIGRWTAEMFLMFNLMRPDIFRSATSACRRPSTCITTTTRRFRWTSCASTARRGARGGRWRRGICGGAWIRCRWSIERVQGEWGSSRAGSDFLFAFKYLSFFCAFPLVARSRNRQKC